MDLRQVEYVLAVADQGSFTRAAEQLHVAQPALSVAIRRLERELGLQLFEGTSRRVSLTAAGEAFVARARRIVSDTTELTAEMAAFAAGTRGRLRISAWYHVEPRLTDFVRDLIAEVPEIDVTIVELSSSDAIAAIKAGDLDAALVDIWDENELAGTEHVVLRREPHVLVTPPKHALAGRASVKLADVLGEPFVVTLPGTPLRRCYDHAFANRSDRPRTVIETNELASTIAFVSIGLGCAILIPSIVKAIAMPVGIVPIADAPEAILAVAWGTGPATPTRDHAIKLVRKHGPESAASGRTEGRHVRPRTGPAALRDRGTLP
jgi:DNA-binding transcriptional LysR family regulator